MPVTKGKEIPVNIMFNLFDSFFKPMLSYGCEVWSFRNTDNLERIHLNRALNVKLTTSIPALYCETGRYPPLIDLQIRNNYNILFATSL